MNPEQPEFDGRPPMQPAAQPGGFPSPPGYGYGAQPVYGQSPQPDSTNDPGYGGHPVAEAQPVYGPPPGYVTQPGVAQPGYPPQPGYGVQPGYQGQAGYGLPMGYPQQAAPQRSRTGMIVGIVIAAVVLLVGASIGVAFLVHNKEQSLAAAARGTWMCENASPGHTSESKGKLKAIVGDGIFQLEPPEDNVEPLTGTWSISGGALHLHFNKTGDDDARDVTVNGMPTGLSTSDLTVLENGTQIHAEVDNGAVQIHAGKITVRCTK